MKIGLIAQNLGISTNTIINWVKRYPNFFSGAAKSTNAKQRMFTDEDVLVLRTINHLRNEGVNLDAIEEELADGYRVEDSQAGIGGVQTRLVPAAAVESIVDASQLRSQLDNVTQERDRLLELLEEAREQEKELRSKLEAQQQDAQQKIEKLREDAQQKIDSLQSQLLDLYMRLGLAEGRLQEIDRGRDQAPPTSE